MKGVMGIELLDIMFRLEKSFGTKIPRGRVFESPPTPTFGFPVKMPNETVKIEHVPAMHNGRRDITAGQIHDRLCELLREQGRPVPFSSWRRVKKVLHDALGVAPSAIKRDSWLVHDLNASV
jgi:hypothetical protein